MASISETLPEGTDAIIEDSAVMETEDMDETAGPEATDEPTEEPGPADKLKAQAGAFKEQAAAKAADLRGQASDHVLAFAAQGKDRATEALDGVAKFVNDAASQVEEKLGPQYAGYARQAADAVSGVATTLRTKNVDELFEDARGYVRKSPAIAIGAAAAAGFVIARLIKAGSETLDATAKDLDGKDAG